MLRRTFIGLVLSLAVTPAFSAVRINEVTLLEALRDVHKCKDLTDDVEMYVAYRFHRAEAGTIERQVAVALEIRKHDDLIADRILEIIDHPIKVAFDDWYSAGTVLDSELVIVIRDLQSQHRKNAQLGAYYE